MSNKVKVPGGAFYAGDGLTVDQTTRTVSAGGGSSVSTPDWNQNDATASDYIKNRPFYTGDTVETVLVEESTATFADTHAGFYMGQIQSTFEATVGETYKVSWDGTVYECTCVDFNGNLAIGNLSIAGAGSDTGEPFLMIVNNGKRIAIYTADTSASHTFSISGLVTEVVKIPDKYISDTFRDVVTAGDPLQWSTDDWAAYYGLFQGGKLLKINAPISSEVVSSDVESYVLSMYYDAGTGDTKITTITTHGGLYYLSTNSYTNELYWTPVFYNEELYLRYIQTGSDTNPNNRKEYDRLDLSNGLSFTTKKANEDMVVRKVVLEGDKEIVLSSSTANSTKKFKITVDDSGTISATEITA